MPVASVVSEIGATLIACPAVKVIVAEVLTNVSPPPFVYEYATVYIPDPRLDVVPTAASVGAAEGLETAGEVELAFGSDVDGKSEPEYTRTFEPDDP